jgi:hypothetical protein
VTTRIGRYTLEDRPRVYQWATGEVEVAGTVKYDSLGRADFLREQIVGMAAPGAEVTVPVVVEDGFAGMIRPSRATTEAVGGSMGKGWFNYSITGQLVEGSREPVVESVLNGVERQNSHTITPYPIHCVPSAATFYGVAGEFQERTTETGPVTAHYHTDFDRVATWSVPVESWYVGGCSVDSETDGVWTPHSCRSALTRSWRLDNGLVRLWPGETEGAAEIARGTFWAQWWTPGGWSTATVIRVGLDGTGGDPPAIAMGEWGPAHIVHVGPERCTVAVRASATSSIGNLTPVYAHVTITRGTPMATLRFTADSASSEAVCNPDPDAVWTEDAGWAYQDPAVSGWRKVVASPEIDAGLLPDGGEFTSLTTPFGIGAAHSTATGWQTHLLLYREWYAALGERMVVGVRS